MNYVLGGRSINAVLARSQGAAAQWWQAGGATGIVAAYQPKGATDYAASKTNLANPGTYNAADGVAPGKAPTWSVSDGWIGSYVAGGYGAYLSCGIVPAPGWTFIVRFTNGDANQLYGSLVAGNDGKDYFIDTLNTTPRYANGGRLSAGSAFTSGVVAVAGGTPYRNGVAVSGTMTPSAAATTIPFFILARNINGSLNFQSSSNARIQAFAIYNTTLDAAQVAAISTAMAAL